jgi:hypothetical protein
MSLRRFAKHAQMPLRGSGGDENGRLPQEVCVTSCAASAIFKGSPPSRGASLYVILVQDRLLLQNGTDGATDAIGQRAGWVPEGLPPQQDVVVPPYLSLVA